MAGVTGVTVLVAFSDPDEFLSELRDRGPNVERVLRLTFRWTPDESGAPVSGLRLVATYLRRVAPDVLAIVQLDHHLGVVWHGVPDPASDQCRERAEQLRTRVRRAAEAHGLDVAAGTHVVATGANVPATWHPRGAIGPPE